MLSGQPPSLRKQLLAARFVSPVETSAPQRNVSSDDKRGERAVFAGYKPIKRPLVTTPRMTAVNGGSSVLV